MKLEPDAVPYTAKPYKTPQAYMGLTKKKVDHFYEIEFVSKVDRGFECAAPLFVIPKKDNIVRFLTDFRKLNTMLKRYPFPLPHMSDIRESIVGFIFATCLDLSMGYYAMLLSETTKQFMVTVLPWGALRIQRPPYGNSSCIELIPIRDE